MSDYTPIEVAVALARYGFNVSPEERAELLHLHFDGDCAEPEELVSCCSRDRVGFIATELAFPTAEVYVAHALERYGEEARELVLMNRAFTLGDVKGDKKDECEIEVLERVNARGEYMIVRLQRAVAYGDDEIERLNAELDEFKDGE